MNSTDIDVIDFLYNKNVNICDLRENPILKNIIKNHYGLDNLFLPDSIFLNNNIKYNISE